MMRFKSQGVFCFIVSIILIFICVCVWIYKNYYLYTLSPVKAINIILVTIEVINIGFETDSQWQFIYFNKIFNTLLCIIYESSVLIL